MQKTWDNNSGEKRRPLKGKKGRKKVEDRTKGKEMKR